jgi:hypothetical protein
MSLISKFKKKFLQTLMIELITKNFDALDLLIIILLQRSIRPLQILNTHTNTQSNNDCLLILHFCNEVTSKKHIFIIVKNTQSKNTKLQSTKIMKLTIAKFQKRENRIRKLCSEQKIEFANYARSKKSNSKIMLRAKTSKCKLPNS